MSKLKNTNELYQSSSQPIDQSCLTSVAETSMRSNGLNFKVLLNRRKQTFQKLALKFQQSEELSYLIFIKKSIQRNYCRNEDRCIFMALNKKTGENIVNLENEIQFTNYLDQAGNSSHWRFQIKIVKEREVLTVEQLINTLQKKKAASKTAALLIESLRRHKQSLADLLKTIPLKYLERESQIFHISCCFCTLKQIQNVLYACSGNLAIVFCSNCRLFQKYLLKDCEIVSFMDQPSYLKAKQIQSLNHGQEIDNFMLSLQEKRKQKNSKIRSILNDLPEINDECQEWL